MNRLRETAWFEGGSRKRIWALLAAYALVALQLVVGTTSEVLAGTESIRDEFTFAGSYSGSNGTLAWKTDWTEVGDDLSPTTGEIAVDSANG